MDIFVISAVPTIVAWLVWLIWMYSKPQVHEPVTKRTRDELAADKRFFMYTRALDTTVYEKPRVYTVRSAHTKEFSVVLRAGDLNGRSLTDVLTDEVLNRVGEIPYAKMTAVRRRPFNRVVVHDV